MRRFVSNLTAAMLLLHALVGCCRHAYLFAGCDHGGCHESTHADCCHSEHEVTDHESELPGSPCDCRLECKSLCVFLPPERPSFDMGQSAPWIDAVAITSTDGAVLGSAFHSCHDTRRSFRIEPPLRLHLLHQILLV